MTTSARRSALAGLLATGLLLAMPAAANAQRARQSDPTGDVITFETRGTNTSETVLSPEDTRTDLTAVTLTYSRAALVVTAHVEDVVGKRGLQPVVRIRGGGGNRYFIGGPGGRVSNPSRKPSRCQGGSWQADKDRDLIRLRVTAACFSSPTKVRAGFGLIRAVSDGETTTEYFDDASAAGRDGGQIAVKLGPTLRRG